MNKFETTTDNPQPRNDINICFTHAERLVVQIGDLECTGPVTITEQAGEFRLIFAPLSVDAVTETAVAPLRENPDDFTAEPVKRKRGRPRKK